MSIPGLDMKTLKSEGEYREMHHMHSPSRVQENFCLRQPVVVLLSEGHGSTSRIDKERFVDGSDKVADFLREFGPEFFVGRREVPILIGGNYDRVDLELFHAGLLCYILVEIKIEKFKHSHVSQMYSYLNWYKQNKMREGQQLPIGLIVCKTRDEETVHYALGDLGKEIFVSEYITNLPTEKEIKKEL